MPPVVAAVATFAANATIAITGSSIAGITVGNFIAANAARFALLGAVATYSSIKQRKVLKAARAALNQGRTVMVRQPIYSRQLIYGQIRTSGPMTFIDETGTNNEYLHLIVPLAGHECEEITTVYFNDEALTLDGSGNVTSPSKYVGHARVKKHLGSPTQTADSDLVSESPRWTSSHRGRSVCYVYVRLKWNTEVYPSGWPNISALVKGKKVYDSRTATTAWSANWALCLADYLTDTRLGLGTDLADIDDTALQVAANISDESVTLNPSGTEARYTCNGQIGGDTTPGDVIDQIVRAGAGFCGYIGGKWVIHAGAYRTPTVGLDENDIRAPLSVQTKLSRAENFNAAKGVFTSPDNDWQPTDYPPITNSTYETQDDGVRIYQDFEWPFTTSNATAQRLSKIALERVRQPIIVNLSCKLTAMQVQAGDNVELTISRMGWTSKVFEVVSATFALDQQGNGPALGYDLILRETASGVWDWNDGEETEIDLAPNTNLPDPRNVAAPTSLLLESGSSEIFTQVDGTVIPRIKATWTLPADTFVQSGGYIRTEFIRTSDIPVDPADAEWIPWTLVRGDVVEEYFTDVESGVNYSIRIRSENTLRASSAWVSDTITVGQKTSAPGVVTGITMVAGNASGYDGPSQYFFGFLTYAAIITFDPPSDSDISYYEYVITDVDTDADADSTPAQVAHDLRIEYNHGNRGISQPWYLRIRSVDRTGNAGNWAALGSDIRNFIGFAAGNLSEQNSDDVSTSGISTGQSGSPTKVLARHSGYTTKTLAGGSPTETFDISLSGLGFSTSPDGGSVQCNNVNLKAGYNKGDPASTSTNARCFVATIDGTNIPSGTYGFNFIFEED
jgi:hypothetical protein